MSTETPEYALPRENRWLGVKNRSHYIPGWYVPHTNLDVPVVCDGVPQGFTISRVLPYRRWALDEKGNTLGQKDFEDRYMQYLTGFEVASTTDLRNESMPNVRAFVRMKYDRVGSLVDMDFEDDGAITKTEKYTEHGEIAPEWMEKNQKQANAIAKMEMLSNLAKEGLLSPSQFQAKVAELLEPTGDDAPVAAPPQGAAPVRSTVIHKKRGRPKGFKVKPRVAISEPAIVASEGQSL